MRQTKRKNRIHKKRQKIKLILLFLIVFLLALIGFFLYIRQIRKPLYISPLPQNKSVILPQSSVDQDLLKKGLSSLHEEIESVKKSDDSYIVDLKDKSQIILSTHKDMKAQISSLQFILARLTMEGKLFTQLDLRYDKPVIRLK